MDKQIFFQGMGKIQAALRTSLTEMELAAYWDVLLKLSNESFVHAVNQSCADFEKFPLPKQIIELARTYRNPNQRIEYHEQKADPEYVKDRMAIIMRIIDGQPNRKTAKQLSDLIDKYPEKSNSLSREAEQWWNQPDGQEWPT